MLIEITTEALQGGVRPRYLLRLSNIDGIEVRVPLGEMSREDADRIATQLVEFVGRAHPGTAVLRCPLDTARLEFLMAQYNMTRESIDIWRDLAAKLVPKYRPWTAEEAPGKQVRRKADTACVRMVMRKVHLAFVLSDNTVWPNTGKFPTVRPAAWR